MDVSEDSEGPLLDCFNKTSPATHRSPTLNDLEMAWSALATHPDQQALLRVKRQFRLQHRVPQSVCHKIAEFLELGKDRMPSVSRALLYTPGTNHRSGSLCNFIMDMGAAFARACDLDPLCEPSSGPFRHGCLDRIQVVYWFELQYRHIVSADASHAPLVTGMLGRLTDGQWFYYKDRLPQLTRPMGMLYHDSYVGIVGTDLHSLLGQLDQAEVKAIAKEKHTLNYLITDRANKLYDLLQLLERNFVHQRPGDAIDISLLQALAPASNLEWLLWRKAGLHDPIDLWKRLEDCWDGHNCWRDAVKFNTAGMFDLSNCLRAFHSAPHVAIDVPIDEVRYTHCSINSVFSHGAHAGLPLQHTVDDLLSQKLGARSEAMILNVVRHRGKLFSLNNRRLWCLKEYAKSLIPPNLWDSTSCSWLRVRVLVWPLAQGVLFDGDEICDKFSRSLTALCDSTSVQLRCQEFGLPNGNSSHVPSCIDPCAVAGPSELPATSELPAGAVLNVLEVHSPTESCQHPGPLRGTVVADGSFTAGFSQPALGESESMIAPIRPSSPVAAISPEEAAEIASEKWASWVEHRAWDAAVRGQFLPAKVVVLRFSRHEQALRNAVLQSEVAARAVLQGADLLPDWAHGGMILVADVYPELFDRDLECFNVVVKDEDEKELLHELEDKLPHRQRQLKAGCGRATVPDQLSLFNISQGDDTSSSYTEFDVSGIRVFRTFIDIPRAKRDARSSRSI